MLARKSSEKMKAIQMLKQAEGNMDQREKNSLAILQKKTIQIRSLEERIAGLEKELQTATTTISSSSNNHTGPRYESSNLSSILMDQNHFIENGIVGVSLKPKSPQYHHEKTIHPLPIHYKRNPPLGSQ